MLLLCLIWFVCASARFITSFLHSSSCCPQGSQTQIGGTCYGDDDNGARICGASYCGGYPTQTCASPCSYAWNLVSKINLRSSSFYCCLCNFLPERHFFLYTLIISLFVSVLLLLLCSGWLGWLYRRLLWYR